MAHSVGFANLPSQVQRKAQQKGFEFTLLLVGESGLGKSTLVSSLFLIDHLYGEPNSREIPTAAERTQKTVEIQPTMVEIEERGVRLRLTVVDTPGFGDSLSGTDQTGPIVSYIDKQFQQYLDDESGLNRRNITDTRVHCCFYFISPHTNGLRPIDVEFMKTLHHKVNIVPIIAKSDTLTITEIRNKKKLILADIEKHGIRIYQLPEADEDEDPGYKKQLDSLKSSVPFAIVGSTETFEVKGKRIRGRLYPWGVVEIENPQHSDFSLLRSMLISHMQDLQEVTHDLHYENYRAQVLQHQVESPVHGKSMTNLIKPETQFVEKKINEKDAEIARMRAMMEQMQAQLHAQNSPQHSGDPGSPHVVPSSAKPRQVPPPPPRQQAPSSSSNQYRHLDV